MKTILLRSNKAWIFGNLLTAFIIVLMLHLLKDDPLGSIGDVFWAVAAAFLLVLMTAAIPFLVGFFFRRKEIVPGVCRYVATALLVLLGGLMIVQA